MNNLTQKQLVMSQLDVETAGQVGFIIWRVDYRDKGTFRSAGIISCMLELEGPSVCLHSWEQKAF